MTILEAVEHNTATPDVIEVEIIGSVTGVAEKAVAEDWPDKEWTRGILLAVGALGKRHGYYGCGPGGDQGGWLFDYVWIDNKRDSLPLVLECEWGPTDVIIDDDFQKLRVARADHRVMIFQGGDIEWHFDRMAKDVRSFAYTQRGDRYLLLGFDWATKRIKSRVLVA
jgi:hypothetical protein